MYERSSQSVNVSEAVRGPFRNSLWYGDGEGMVASTHAETLARALLGGQTAPIQEPHSSHADVKQTHNMIWPAT